MVRMITDELLDFLRAQLAEGMSTSELEELLIAEGGWTSEDVAEALRRVNETSSKVSVSSPSPESPSAEQTSIAPTKEAVPVVLPSSQEDSLPSREDVTIPATPAAPSSNSPESVIAPSVMAAPTPLPLATTPPTSPQEVAAPSAPLVKPLAPPAEPLPSPLKEESVARPMQTETAVSPSVTSPSVKEEPPLVVPTSSPVDTLAKRSDAAPSSSPDATPSVASQGAPLASFRPLPLSSLDRVSEPPSRAKEEPVEDFLGIFSGESSPSLPAPASTTPPLTIPMFAQPTPVPLSGDEFALDADEGDARTTISSESSTSNSTPKTTSSGPFVFGKKPEWSFRDMLEQKRTPMEGRYKEITPSADMPTLEPEPQEKTVQFDLSKIAGVNMEDAGVSLPDTAPAHEKTVETRSLAEVWASGGAKNEKKDTHSPKPYTSSTPRAPVPKKRTMSSDLLLHEKRTTSVAPPPAVSVHISPSETTPVKRNASEILLRGKGVSMPSIPAVSDETLPSPAPLPAPTTLPESPSSLIAKAKKPLTKSTLVTSKTPISLAEELRKKNKIKRILGSTLIVLLLSLVFGGLLFVMLSMRGSRTTDVLRTAITNITTTPSFAYRGSASSSLSLVSNVDGVERSGRINFDLLFSGSVRNTPNGFGDGTHQLDIKGDLSTVDHEWGADVKADVRVVGDALYFSLLRYPEGSDIDPDVAATYWVKVDLSAVMRELALQGATTPDGNYGSFGGNRANSSFSGLYLRYNPLVYEDALPDDVLEGRATRRFLLRANPESMSDFLIALYRKYTGEELKLTSDEALRFRNAVAKITAEVWVDSETEQLLRLSVHGDFDDDIVGVRVRGPVRIDVRLSEHGQALDVTAPTPFLTLEEFWVRINDYKQNKDLRIRDAAKRDTLQKLITALSKYREREGKFPLTLLGLRTARDLTTGEVSDATLRSFTYVPYVSSSDLSRAGRCGPQTGCAYYHLGVNFEDLTNPHLRTDADVVSEISGKDSAGCAGERDRACFDVVSVEAASSREQ